MPWGQMEGPGSVAGSAGSGNWERPPLVLVWEDDTSIL